MMRGLGERQGGWQFHPHAELRTSSDESAVYTCTGIIGPVPGTFDDASLMGPDFQLRPLIERDVDDVVAACQDELTQEWLPLPRPYTREVALGFITSIAPVQQATGGGLVRAIDIAGRVCGVIDLKHTDWRAQVTQIGYWVAPWARGEGLAGRASRLLSNWALDDQGMERVEIRVALGNVGSRRTALSAGFQSEGIARSAGFIHGGRVDLEVLSRIKADL